MTEEFKENEKIKVNFEYNEQIVSLLCEPYKTIGEIKKKALRKIYGANKGLHCYYLNRDLYRKENEQLGNFFPKRKVINLVLMMPLKLLGENDENNQEEFFGEPLLNTNLYSNLYNHTTNKLKSPIFYAKKKYSKNLAKTERNLESRLHPAKSFALSNNSRNNKFPSLMDDTYEEENPNYFCSNCDKRTIGYFCRNCQDFLCEECKKLPKHNNHLTIKIDPFNLEENIKLYIMIIQTDIEQNININEEYYKNFYESDSGIDNDGYRERLIKKLEKLALLYISIITKLKQTYSKTNNEGVDMIINEYNLNSRIISGELNNILTDIYSNYTQTRKKMVFNQFKNYFNMINEKEKNWNILTKNILVFKVNNDINEKLTRFYEKTENELDELMNSKTPFLLEKKEIEFIEKVCGPNITGEENSKKDEELIDEENDRNKEVQLLKEKTERRIKNKKEKENIERKEIKSLQNDEVSSEMTVSVPSSKGEEKKRNMNKKKTAFTKK